MANGDEIKKLLRACIVSHKGGVHQNNLDDEFFKFTGIYIPCLALGYTSLYQYLSSVPELQKRRNKQNDLVFMVSSPKVAHIASMVEKQKDPQLKKNENYNRKRKAVRDVPRGRRDQKRQKRHMARNKNAQSSNQAHAQSVSTEDGLSDYERCCVIEYNHPVRITERPQKLNVVCEPIVNGKQLIGDDFFLQLAIRNLGQPIWRKGPCLALRSGLCVSGQTIADCKKALNKVEALSNKLVIMLGAEDIYKNRTSEEMIDDMQDLLKYLQDRFAFSKSAITLCTIPPLANLAMNCHRSQLTTLHVFNSWLREQTHFSSQSNYWDSTLRYNLIDFYRNNTNAQIATAYNLFQLDARMVSGSSHPYVLWNVPGRRLAMNLLQTGYCN